MPGTSTTQRGLTQALPSREVLVARRANPTPRKSTVLSVDEMRSGVTKLGRRILELESYDLSSVHERSDANISALTRKINSTLQDILGIDSIEYEEYSISSMDTLPIIIGQRHSPQEIQAGYKKGFDRAVAKLRALQEIFEERIGDSVEQPQVAPSRSPGRKIFVVHGHDNGLKETVARFLTRLQLDPIILHEKPNEGRTIIEKFEKHSEVDFAVVLFSPDDLAYRAGESASSAKHRARQNVVLELGFFMGSLGRNKVAALYAGDLELPSDYAGVVYVPIDAAGAWKYALAREIRSAGITVDMNLID